MHNKHGRTTLLLLLLGIISFSLVTMPSEGSAADSRLSLTYVSGDYSITEYGGFDVIEMESFSNEGEPGSPSLPIVAETYSLPSGIDAEAISLAVRSQISAPVTGEYVIEPVSSPIAVDIVDTSIHSAYSTDDWYPESPISITCITSTRDATLVTVTYSPFQYNPVQKRLRLTSRVDVDIVWYSSYMYSTEMEGQDNEGYVIVTTNEIVSNSNQLSNYVSHLESRGFSTTVITENDYGTEQGQQRSINIRSWLASHYISDSIQYVLLIGNPDPEDPTNASDSYGDVPMMMCFTKGSSNNKDVTNVPTDYFYADLTGDWDLNENGKYGEYGYDGNETDGGVDFGPEVYVGRIPVYNSKYSELDSILNKIINYDGATHSILLPIAISNYSEEGSARTDGLDVPKYILQNVASPQGYSSTVQYETSGTNAVPTSAYGYTEPLSSSNVISRWQEDYGVIYWWAHGSPSSANRKYWNDSDGDGTIDSGEMTTPAFITSGSSLLSSAESFVFQCSCLNGYPEYSTNLGYDILRDGAIATVSASRISFYETGNWDMSDINDRSNSTIGYVFVEGLVADNLSAGEALYDGKAGLSSATYWAEYGWQNMFGFNLYGDPSLSIDVSSNTAPDQPQLSSPSNGSTDIDTDVGLTLEWSCSDPDDDELTYNVYLDKEVATPTTKVAGDLSLTSYTVSSLEKSSTYYWRIEAVDIFGASRFSDVWHFSTEDLDPSLELSTTSIDAGILHPSEPWDGSFTIINAGGHELSWSIDSIPSWLGVAPQSGSTTDESIVSLDIDAGDLEYGEHSATLGISSNGGSAQLTVIVSSAPGKPTGLSAESGINGTIVLTWNEVTGADSYDIFRGEATGFEPTLKVAEGILGCLFTDTVANGLSDGSTYYYVVCATAENVDSYYSLEADALCDSAGPSIPLPQTPNDASQLADGMVEFAWDPSTDSGSGLQGYELEYSSDAVFADSITITDITGSSHTPGIFSDGTYYWHVRSVDVLGNVSSWSDTYSFTVAIKPQLDLPADGCEMSDSTPSLSWLEVSGASTYQVQVSTSQTCDPLLVVVNVSGTSFTIPAESGFTDGTYYWRVSAFDDASQMIGNYSDVRSFIIDTIPPEAPQQTLPQPGEVVSSSHPEFEWDESEDAVAYALEVSTSTDTNPDGSFVDIYFASQIDGISASSLTPDVEFENGIYYWHVCASDGAGNSCGWTQYSEFEVDAVLSLTIDLAQGWNSLSLPFTVAMEDLVAGISGEFDGYIYWFDPSEQRYKYYNVVSITNEPEYPSEFDTLPVGSNFWLWLYDESGSITIEGEPESCNITLYPGWNVVSCVDELGIDMDSFVSEINSINEDYDGYMYLFDRDAQQYRYYNVLIKTNEPEYPSEFTMMEFLDVIWIYFFS